MIGRRLAERETTDKGFGSAPTTGQGRGQICVRSDPTVICLYFLDLSWVFSWAFFSISYLGFCASFQRRKNISRTNYFIPERKHFLTIPFFWRHTIFWHSEEKNIRTKIPNTKIGFTNQLSNTSICHTLLYWRSTLFCGSFKCRLSGPHPQLH